MTATLGFFFDPLHWNSSYILYVMLPCMALALWAQYRVHSAYSRASKRAARSGVTGAEAAAMILQRSGVPNPRIERTEGFLSDHYDPRSKTLRLSPQVFEGRDLAALGVAAHEAGHALQDAQRYGPLVARNAIVPLAGIGSNLGVIILIVGFAMGAMGLAAVGVGLFALTVVFQLINLPCEFDASTRAREQLQTLGLVSMEEDVEVRRVLSAAAMTYVAGVISSLMTLLYYVSALSGREE